MKRTTICLAALLGLTFVACKKDNEKQPEQTQKIDMISIKGIDYPKDSILAEFAKGLGWDTSTFYFDQTHEVFILKGYDGSLLPEKYLILKDK
ncbi:hypothetical protein [Sphingobacterium sp. SYP-B4668]|uniref:hypothetical protein n=1 Tax=Sphingobacterium sp. SYP-B4668 TaxID=2996035 RepID=UPI0022DD5D38|nr:hypothetical protein [Sphingobacterium sp. SYP-B4668]